MTTKPEVIITTKVLMEEVARIDSEIEKIAAQLRRAQRRLDLLNRERGGIMVRIMRLEDSQ